MWKLILNTIAGILSLWLATIFVAGVKFNGPFFLLPGPGLTLDNFLGTLLFAGFLLGFLNSFVKPILKIITFPLRIVTLNLFTFLISIFLVWITDIVSLELVIRGFLPLFWTTIIILGVNFIFSKLT